MDCLNLIIQVVVEDKNFTLCKQSIFPIGHVHLNIDLIYAIDSSWNIFLSLREEVNRNVLVSLFVCYQNVEYSVEKLVL